MSSQVQRKLTTILAADADGTRLKLNLPPGQRLGLCGQGRGEKGKHQRKSRTFA